MHTINTNTKQNPVFSKTVAINASAQAIWQALTDAEQMQQWMSETPIDIATDWMVGSSIHITGKHYKMYFENKGIINQFLPYTLLEYTHLSSISRLKDEPDNYSILTFNLVETNNATELTLTIKQFPTETIYKHLAFYWFVTMEKIKKQVEESM